MKLTKFSIITDHLDDGEGLADGQRHEAVVFDPAADEGAQLVLEDPLERVVEDILSQKLGAQAIQQEVEDLAKQKGL